MEIVGLSWFINIDLETVKLYIISLESYRYVKAEEHIEWNSLYSKTFVSLFNKPVSTSYTESTECKNYLDHHDYLQLTLHFH